MKITVSENEIREAIVEYMQKRILLNDGSTMKIDFTAGRGPNGLSAEIDIEYLAIKAVGIAKPQAALPTQVPAVLAEDNDEPEMPDVEVSAEPKNIFGN